MPDDKRCPECGEPYEYRLRNSLAYEFRVTNEYRCDPDQHPYVYFHEIPTGQAEAAAYGSHHRPDGGVVVE